jgi:hypothetical protein
LTGFEPQAGFADIECAGQATADYVTFRGENLVIEKFQGIAAFRLTAFEQIVTHHFFSVIYIT